MRKLWIGAIALLLSVSFLFCAAACSKDPEQPQEETSGIEYGTAQPGDALSWEEKPVAVPEYDKIDSMLFENGQSDYSIVVAEGAAANTYTAASELNYFVSLASGVTFSVRAAEDVTWSADAKYISVGENIISQAAGVTVPDTLNSHGFAVRTVGKSLFLQGVTSTGDIFAVYDLLSKVLGYDYYAADEIAIATASSLACPDFNYTDEPDIEYRSSQIGYQSGTVSTRYRVLSAQFMSPEGASTWHNSLQYIPYNVYGTDYPEWFATDLKGLCLTAHGDTEKYEKLVETVAGKMEDVLEKNPDGDTIAFTHMDVGTWCTCEHCTALKNKYGTDSASMIIFMNDVVEQVEQWRKANQPGRDNIRYLFFAYTATVQAPVKEEGGKIVPIDDAVKFHDKLGVIYAPISSDFFHGKNEPQNSSYLKQMQEWNALAGENMYYWFYQSYFYNYFLFYNNFDSMQDNYRAAVDNGAVWMYDQSQYNNAASTGFQMLKVYLSSKLMWDVNADVTALTQNFFDRYFKAASQTMYDLFTAIRLNYLWMSESQGVSGWIGTRVNTSEYFKLNTLLEWEQLIEQAYEDIAPLQISDAALYEKVHDRINLESLSVRYLLIDLYGTQLYTTQELYEQKVQFKQDCAALNITRLSEGELVTVLWSQWGI